jgi:hypothetical protein
MQAIGIREIQRAEPSQKLVLAAAGALVAILCLLVLVAASLNSGSTRTATVNQPAMSVAQGAGQHSRSEQADTTPAESGDSGVSQRGHGFLP